MCNKRIKTKAGKPTYEALEQRIAMLEDESARRNRFEAINSALFKISDAVSTTSSLDELFRAIHIALSSIIDTTNFFIALYDKQTDCLTFPYRVDSVDECFPSIIEVSKTASLSAEVIRTGRPVFVTKAERLRNLSKSSLIKLGYAPAEIWLGVPLKALSAIIGVMAVQSYHDPMCFDHTDMDVMVSVADQVAIAVERKQVEEALGKSETKYHLIAENTADQISILDMNLRFTYVSPSIMRFRGFTVEETMEQTLEQILTPVSLRLALDVFENEMLLEAGGTADPDRTRILELEEYKKDGSVFWVEVSFSFLRDKDLKPIEILSVTRDITHRKRMEAEKAELENQNRQLQKAESLDRMAGAIAHNFNNQLQVVIGNLEMAMSDPPGGLESLAEALKASRKAADISAMMLTYSGKLPGKYESIDLSAACRKSLSLLQAAAPKGTILKADFPASGGPVIRANASQIQQVLTNLVINAWESADESQRGIGLTVKAVSQADIPAFERFPAGWKLQEGGYACLEVADAGCGIASKDIENLFDPFYSTKFTGRGMGLSVVLGIVKSHNGGITVESQPDRGSIFRVYFPLSAEKIHCEPNKPIQSPEMQGGGTVLLIEDEEQVRKLAITRLTHLGYRVIEAKDGLEALEIFQQHQDEIRFVLSDLTMPRMNGWDTLAALRKLSPDIPVILSSGYDEAQVMAGEHPEQPNAFLGKPYRLQELKDTVRLALAGKGKSITQGHNARTDSSAAKKTGECHNDQ